MIVKDRKPKRKKGGLYLSLMAMLELALAFSMGWHNSFWAKYLHILVMLGLFVFFAWKIESIENHHKKGK